MADFVSLATPLHFGSSAAVNSGIGTWQRQGVPA